MSELDDPLSASIDKAHGEASYKEPTRKRILDSEDWPAELIDKYHHLEIPSLYNFLLSQEKLALEIRRQNRELILQKEVLRDIAETSTTVKASMQIFQDSLEWGSANSGSDHVTMEKKLMEGMDVLFSLLHGSEELSKSLEEVIPKKQWFIFSRKPAWRTQMEGILHGYMEGLRTAHQKMVGTLADAEITLIQPLKEDLFSPDCHRAIEMVEGGKSRTIHQVIRYGYRKGTALLRPADVSVYL